jgi:hypothetical protein
MAARVEWFIASDTADGGPLRSGQARVRVSLHGAGARAVCSVGADRPARPAPCFLFEKLAGISPSAILRLGERSKRAQAACGSRFSCSTLVRAVVRMAIKMDRPLSVT